MKKINSGMSVYIKKDSNVIMNREEMSDSILRKRRSAWNSDMNYLLGNKVEIEEYFPERKCFSVFSNIPVHLRWILWEECIDWKRTNCERILEILNENTN